MFLMVNKHMLHVQHMLNISGLCSTHVDDMPLNTCVFGVCVQCVLKRVPRHSKYLEKSTHCVCVYVRDM